MNHKPKYRLLERQLAVWKDRQFKVSQETIKFTPMRLDETQRNYLITG
nr:MAG TPA: hypothetical protein [Crassvirales sp.]